MVQPAVPLAVLDPAFCAQAPLVLKAQENLASLSGDSFTVTGEDGRVWYKVDAKMFSMREKKAIVDASGRPVAGLKKKLVALKPTLQLFRGGDFEHPVATIRQKMMTIKPSVVVTLEGQEEASYKAKGNFLAKKFEVLAVAGGQEREIAKIHKESRFSSTTAFAKAMMTDKQAYFIEVAPGADVAFLVALCVAIDEIFQEKKD
ncbi:hypothetical protein ABPG77_008253 [Micractinium sp. CCAP 211/92]